MAKKQTNIRLPEELRKQIISTKLVPAYYGNLSERIIRLLEIALSKEAHSSDWDKVTEMKKFFETNLERLERIEELEHDPEGLKKKARG